MRWHRVRVVRDRKEARELMSRFGGGYDANLYTGPGTLESLVGQFLDTRSGIADQKRRQRLEDQKNARADELAKQHDTEFADERALRDIQLQGQGIVRNPTELGGGFTRIPGASDAEHAAVATNAGKMQLNQLVAAALREKDPEKRRAAIADIASQDATEGIGLAEHIQNLDPKPVAPRNIDPNAPDVLTRKLANEKELKRYEASLRPAGGLGEDKISRVIDTTDEKGQPIQIGVDKSGKEVTRWGGKASGADPEGMRRLDAVVKSRGNEVNSAIATLEKNAADGYEPGPLAIHYALKGDLVGSALRNVNSRLSSHVAALRTLAALAAARSAKGKANIDAETLNLAQDMNQRSGAIQDARDAMSRIHGGSTADPSQMPTAQPADGSVRAPVATVAGQKPRRPLTGDPAIDFP